MTPPKQTDRAFGLTFAGVFAIIFAVAALAFDKRPLWAGAGALGFLAVALGMPGLLLPLNRLWRQFAGVTGYISNHLLLGLFYYLFVTPLGLTIRLLGQDPMCRTKEPASATYWTPVHRQTNADTLEDMF